MKIIRSNIYIVMLFLLVIILVMRRPDMLINPQPWAEDGTIFISDAINKGFISIFHTYAGYYHLIPRLVSWLSVYISLKIDQSLALTPLFMNTAAILISGATVSFLCIKRFDWLAPLKWRALAAVLIVLLSGVTEIFGTITNSHWWIGYFQFLIMLDMMVMKRFPTWKIQFILLVCALSGPMGIISAVGAFYLLVYKFIKKEKIIPFYLLSVFVICIGPLIEGIAALMNRVSGDVPANIQNFIVYFPRVLFSGVFSRPFLPSYQSTVRYLEFPTVVIIGFTIALVAYLLVRKKEIYFVSIAAMILLLLLTFKGSPSLFVLYNNDFYDVGGRYFFVPLAIFLTVLSNCLPQNFSRTEKKYYVGVLLFIIITMSALLNYKLPAYADFNWKETTKVLNLNGSSQCQIPINPQPWTLSIPCNQ